MKLREKLTELKGRSIKLGSAMAFFYIGSVEDDIEDTINAINDDYIQRDNDSLARFEKASMASDDAIRKQVITNEKKKKNPQEFTEEQMVQMIAEERKRLEKVIENKKKYLNTAVRMLDREVLNVYPADEIFDDEDLIVIIEGKENGDYWFRSEYEKARLAK